MSGWWTRAEVQEGLALALVALVAAFAVARWRLRRRRGAAGCAGCHGAAQCPIDTTSGGPCAPHGHASAHGPPKSHQD